MRKTASCAVVLLALAARSALAQLPPLPPPGITTVGHGETRVSPDRATLLAAVETRARTAAEAAAGNATTQTRVIAALRALGLDADQVTTVGYNVQPEYRYDPNGGGRPQVVGYVARNTVRAEMRRVDQVGRAIDAALGAGANRIAGVNFFASNQDEARRAALGIAVANACRDAEVMARAIGSSLAGVLDVTAMDFGFPPPRPMMDMAMARGAEMAQAPETPIEAGDITVRVQVNARFGIATGSASGAFRCGGER